MNIIRKYLFATKFATKFATDFATNFVTKYMTTNMTVLVLAFSISGCKQIDTPNGEAPKEYLELLKGYIADYKGAMDANPGVLRLFFDGKKFHIGFTGKINDVTGDERCKSQLGDLQSIQVNDEGTILEAASFAFSSPNCQLILGRSVNLIFSKNGPRLELSVSILKEFRQIQICQDTPPPSPTRTCRRDIQNFYFSGIFEKP